ncbi:MAG: GDSL-type esterase/lipase family protein [Bradymonadia bacterium]
MGPSRLISLAPLCLGLLACGGAQGQVSVALPENTIILEIPEARLGPPELSCADALAHAAAEKEKRDAESSAAISGDPSKPVQPVDAPEATTVKNAMVTGNAAKRPTLKGYTKKDKLPLTRIIVDRRKVKVKDLPGGKPDELPLQPLEGPTKALEKVAEVMRKMTRGERTRLSFYGASHTGADMWTGQVRRVLQGKYGDIGHGFIFPAALYKGYRGADINLCRTDDWRPDYVGKRGGRGDGLYGFAGASLSSNDPLDFGWVETTHESELGRVVSHYEIFALGQPEGGTLVLQVDETPMREVSTARDAHGLVHISVRVPEGPHRLTLRPKGDGEIRLFGVSAERNGPGVLVDAMGIRGRTARTQLSWDADLFGAGLKALSPDLLVLAYGTNEANARGYTDDGYREDLREVLANMRKIAPDAACILAGPTDRGKKISRSRYRIWARTAPVAQVQREVAGEFDCVFWDWQKAMGGEGSMIAWRLLKKPYASKDLIHLRYRGYVWSADRLIAAMEATVK